MDYLKCYNELVFRGQIRELDCYTENHHIIPKCFGGTNKRDNLTKLTAREHIIAHMLLYKMQKDKRKMHQMLTAVIMMKGRNKNSRLYEKA